MEVFLKIEDMKDHSQERIDKLIENLELDIHRLVEGLKLANKQNRRLALLYSDAVYVVHYCTQEHMDATLLAERRLKSLIQSLNALRSSNNRHNN